MKPWYEIKAKDNGPAEIWLYGEIGRNFFGEGLDPLEFIKELNALKAKQIDMHIHSPGGNVFDGDAIYAAIDRHPATITAYIDGMAASIASLVTLAADRVLIAKNSNFMIHNPRGSVYYGEPTDMRQMADRLDQVRATMAGTYASASGKPLEEIFSMMDKETWLNAEAAVEAGFADAVEGEIALAACVEFVPIMAKAGFKHIPREIIGQAGVPPEKDLERALRDVGCSIKQAKSILAKGYSDALRDVGPTEPAPAAEPPRDVEPPKPASKGDVHDLLIRTAQLLVPSSCKEG